MRTQKFSAFERALWLPLLLCIALTGLLSCTTLAPSSVDTTALDAAIAGPQRSEANRARDVYRHPKETLLFFGLRPDQTVIEIAPGGGWYTEILAPTLRAQGKLYAAHNSATDTAGGPKAMASRQRGLKAYQDKLAKNPEMYDRVVVGTLPVKTFTDIQPPGGADMVLTFRNIHNWMADGHLDGTLKAFYAVLKPGGVLGVEEHRASPGTPLEKMIDTGYVTEAYVIERAQAAGFVLAAKSEINANPRDTKDYPQGVWALPPTYSDAKPEDRERLKAIGESDRMTLRFVKPR